MEKIIRPNLEQEVEFFKASALGRHLLGNITLIPEYVEKRLPLGLQEREGSISASTMFDLALEYAIHTGESYVSTMELTPHMAKDLNIFSSEPKRDKLWGESEEYPNLGTILAHQSNLRNPMNKIKKSWEKNGFLFEVKKYDTPRPTILQDIVLDSGEDAKSMVVYDHGIPTTGTNLYKITATKE